jgi:hypothetical protein
MASSRKAAIPSAITALRRPEVLGSTSRIGSGVAKAKHPGKNTRTGDRVAPL